MAKFWSLFRIFMKTAIGSSLSLNIAGKERKGMSIALWIIVAISLAPILWIFYSIMTDIFTIFHHIGELPVGVGFILNIGALLIFLFSFIAAPALFYFAKDVEYVLPLPLKPTQIIGAKFAVALAFEYLLALAIMGTMFFALTDFVPIGVLSFSTIITVLVLPILPMAYSTILVMLIMRVSRLGSNPDRYTMFVGILAVVLAVGLSMYMGQAFQIDGEALVAALNNQPVAMTTLNAVFIGNGFAALAFGAGTFFGGALHNLIISIAIAAVALVIFFALAKVLYFPGVIGLSESGSSRKKSTVEDISKNTRGQSKFLSYLGKEMKLIFRSPTVFANCVIGAFVMPMILLISVVPIIRSGELSGLANMVDFSNPRTNAFALVIMTCIGFYMGGMTSITSTSISREGKNLFIMKYLPVSYSTQLLAKGVSGIFILIPALILIIIPIQLFFQAPLWLFVCGLILMFPGALFVNFMGLYVDLLRPKLTWDNEQAAVKQSLNVVIVMLVSWAIATVIVAVGWFMLRTPWVAFFGLLGVTGVLAYIAYWLSVGRGYKLMERLH